MIYQRKIEVSQDEINYPRKYTNHIIRLYRLLTKQDTGPTQGTSERWEDLKIAFKPFVKTYATFIDEDMKSFLKTLKENEIPVILFDD